MTVNAWIAGLMGGVFLLLAGTITVLLVINADLRADIATGDAARSVLIEQNKSWADKTAQANASLERIRAADAARAKAIAKAQADALKAESVLKNEARKIAALRLSGTVCAQVEQLRTLWFGHLLIPPPWGEARWGVELQT